MDVGMGVSVFEGVGMRGRVRKRGNLVGAAVSTNTGGSSVAAGKEVASEVFMDYVWRQGGWTERMRQGRYCEKRVYVMRGWCVIITCRVEPDVRYVVSAAAVIGVMVVTWYCSCTPITVASNSLRAVAAAGMRRVVPSS